MIFSTLNNLNSGESARIYSLNTAESLKKRLMDMGFIKGAGIECLFSSKGDEISAYLVRDTVIALRREDAMGIVTVVA